MGEVKKHAMDLQEQIQEDLLIYLDGFPNEVLNQICKIVVDNFRRLEDG